jgi:hypothetical protein
MSMSRVCRARDLPGEVVQDHGNRRQTQVGDQTFLICFEIGTPSTTKIFSENFYFFHEAMWLTDPPAENFEYHP